MTADKISQINPERPKARPGFVATSVQWDLGGRIVHAKYEPIAKAAPDHPSESARPTEKQPIRRGVVAAAKPHQGELL